MISHHTRYDSAVHGWRRSRRDLVYVPRSGALIPARSSPLYSTHPPAWSRPGGRFFAAKRKL